MHVNDIIGSAVSNKEEEWNCLHRGSRYRIARMLGQGTFGQVVKCWDEVNHRIVAVKVLKNKASYFRQGLLEIGILTAINTNCDRDKRNHCLRILDHFLYKNHLCIVNELLGVNLYEMLRSGGFQVLTISAIRSYLKQILIALKALSDHGVIHCDLKPENIMVDGPHGEHVTLIDFGSACFTNNKLFTYIQSRHYRAPEIILEHPYSCQIDMWSLGCVAAEFFIGHPLFPGSSEYNQLYKITQLIGDVPDKVINGSRKGSKFYKNVEGGYVLMTPQEYAARAMRPEEFDDEMNDSMIVDRKFLAVDSLEELVEKATIKIDPNDQSANTPGEIREYLLDFLKRIFTYDPNERLTAGDALNHPFITGKRGTFQPSNLSRDPLLVNLQPKNKIEGNFREIYSTFINFIYVDEIVVDTSSGITLVKLEPPVVPARDSTQRDERVSLGNAKNTDKDSTNKENDDKGPTNKEEIFNRVKETYRMNLEKTFNKVKETDKKDVEKKPDESNNTDNSQKKDPVNSNLFSTDKVQLMLSSPSSTNTHSIQKRKDYDISSIADFLKNQ